MHIISSIIQAFRNFFAGPGTAYAAYMAYNAVLSIFPLFIFIAAIAGLFGDRQIADHIISDAFHYLPANVAETIRPIIVDVLTKQQPSLLTFGIFATLWANISGLEALRTGLNIAYHCDETRPIWRRYLQSMMLVIAGGLLIVVLFVTIIAGPLISTLSEHFLHPGALALQLWDICRYIIGFIAINILLTLSYILLPNRQQRMRDVIPGSLLASILWLLTATLFSTVVDKLTNYSAVYGSLGNVITILLFFQITSIIVITGAEFNNVMLKDNK